jgi:hypothetical protein
MSLSGNNFWAVAVLCPMVIGASGYGPIDKVLLAEQSAAAAEARRATHLKTRPKDFSDKTGKPDSDQHEDGWALGSSGADWDRTVRTNWSPKSLVPKAGLASWTGRPADRLMPAWLGDGDPGPSAFVTVRVASQPHQPHSPPLPA